MKKVKNLEIWKNLLKLSDIPNCSYELEEARIFDSTKFDRVDFNGDRITLYFFGFKKAYVNVEEFRQYCEKKIKYHS